MSAVESRIIVGVDGSEQSQAALGWAIGQAELVGADLVLAHTWNPDSYATPAMAGAVPDMIQAGALNDEAEELAQAWLDDLVTATATRTTASVSGVLASGSPAGHVLDLSAEAIMVVVGSRGRGGLRSAVLGSTSQQIAHHAQCPVVVVRDSSPTSGHQVVVGVDGSPASLAALREAFAQAKLRGASLLMVHAWSTSFAGTLVNSGQDFDRVRASEVDEGWALLNQSLAELQATDQSVEIIERLEQASPAAAIIEASKEAVLTVVGSRGRGGFAGLVLGSVSGSVLAHADSAVMVIRA
ncbi:MAG: universal stress protein [Actinomycetes bacterium]